MFGSVGRIVRCVKNWYDVFLVTRGLKKEADIVFVDGTVMKFRKENHAQLVLYCDYLDMPKKMKESLKMKKNGDRIYLHVKNRLIRARPSNANNLADEFSGITHGKLDVKNRTVLDIGTAGGETALYYVVAGDAKKVYSYEINKWAYTNAIKLIKENGLGKRIKIFNEGITPDNINKLPFIDELNDASLKCDIEGAEYKIFEAITDETLSHFKHMHIEYHFGYKPIVERLEKAGFRVEYTKPYYVINPLPNFCITEQGDIYATRG